MTRLLGAGLALLALLVRHLFCAHRARTTRPATLLGPGGRQLYDVHCPHCKTHWTEFAKKRECMKSQKAC